MSAISVASPSNGILNDRPSGLVHAVCAYVVRKYEYRRTLQALRALDARALHDLGLERAALPRIARQAVFDAH